MRIFKARDKTEKGGSIICGQPNARRLAQFSGMKKDPEQIIQECRQEIDAIDGAIVALIKRRVDFAKKIGAAKAELGRQITDERREKEVLSKVKASARAENLPEGESGELYEKIIEFCRNIEEIKEGTKENKIKMEKGD